MDIVLVILGAVTVSGVIFFLIYQLVSLPIRTSGYLDKDAIERYYKTKSYFRSGEAPPSFFREELVEKMKENGAQIITENMICIGKRKNNSFIPSPLLLSYFTQKDTQKEKKIEIKTIENGAYLKDDGTTYHPGHFHYRIFDNAILFHREDNITYFLHGSWYVKKKFKEKFDKEWKEGTPLDGKNLTENNSLVELDYHKYEKAKIEDIKKLKKEAKIEN